MRRFGVIENPWSQQNKKRKEPLEDAVRTDQDIAYARLDQFTDLPKVLKDFAEQGVELLVLSGGDGTVQGCLTLLSDKSPFERMPPIAILPDGMTNMTAADVGLREKGARGLVETNQRLLPRFQVILEYLAKLRHFGRDNALAIRLSRV